MVVRSTFYDTTPGQGVLETEWARSARSRGATYGVIGADSLRLTAHPTTPYAVNISPGSFFGQGVWDENLSDVRVDCVAPAANATRWDLIAARRDWQPTGGGPTSFVAIRGGTTAAIPAARENRPGVVDDQPIWLVKWKGGKTQPEEIIDLRAWAGPGGVEVAHRLALDYLAEPGAAVKLGPSTWRYEAQANGVWGWREDKPPAEDAPLFRSGFRVVRTNRDGFCTVPYSKPFPGGTTVAVPAPMDPPGGMTVVRFVSGERAAANFRVFASTGQVVGDASVGIAYIATGY